MSRIHYRIEDLRALLALEALGSFVRAAEELHITQSAFSRRIAQLEDLVGGRLVERTSRRVALSALGRSLAQDARTLLPRLDQALEDASRQASGEAGSVSLACLSTVACSSLPIIHGRFRAAFPKVRLHVRDDTGQRVTQSVLNHEAEWGISVVASAAEGLTTQSLGRDPFVLAFASDHPLAAHEAVAWRDLQRWNPITLSRNSANRLFIDKALEQAGIASPWFDEVEHLSTMLGFLRHGAVVGVLPRLALGAQSHGLSTCPLVEPVVSREIALIRRSETTLSKPSQFLWDALAQTLQGAEVPHSAR